jgi:uncharacterized protein YecT (DUF1311 family)
MRQQTTIIGNRTTALLALLILGGVTSAHAQDANYNCADPQTQQEMNYCADKDFQKADKELNTVYKKAVASQAAIDKEAADSSDQRTFGAVKALKKAQRGWIDYRDGQCEGEGFEVAGGSLQPMFVSGCKARLTQSRTKELRELIKGQGN